MRIFDQVKNITLTSICLILLSPILLSGLPLITGEYRSDTVVGESMTPTLRAGDLLITKAVDPDEIEIGDILTVRFGGIKITHRLVDIIEAEITFFRLKGDANENPDSSLYAESQVIGRVVLVFPFSHLYTAYGFALALVVPFALLRSRLRSGETPMRDTRFLLLFFILIISSGLTISHYFLNLKAV